MKKLLFAGIMLALLSFAFIHKNERIITGTVKGDKGNAVAFAIVKVKGKNQSATANTNGNFELKVDDKVKILEVFAVGFQTKEIQ